jgi:hypothetical protein
MELPTLPADRSHSHSPFVNQQDIHFTSMEAQAAALTQRSACLFS